ncbi:hypothetical protein Tco_1117710, partial [Tanacetum coccineum]
MGDCQGGKVGGIRVLVERGKGYYPLDANYAGCKDTFKSTSGGAQFLGEKLVSWSSKKQRLYGTVNREARICVFIPLMCPSHIGCGHILMDYGCPTSTLIPSYCDSKSSHSTWKWDTVELYLSGLITNRADRLTKATQYDRLPLP